MFQNLTDTAELVVFWEGQTIDRVMIWPDFQACLDGYVGLAPYAGQQFRAAYVSLDEALRIRAIVLFHIGFDREGFPERSWNLPLRHMAEVAGAGPDFGDGYIRLACRSQCPISWHTDRLWDPMLDSGHNELAAIRRAVKESAPRLGLRATVQPPPPVVVSAPSPIPVDSGIPVLSQGISQVEIQQRRRLEEMEREKEGLRHQQEELQLRIRSLETDSSNTLAQASFEHEQQLAILNAQNAKLLNQHRTLKQQNDALREQLEALKGQLVNVASLHENRLYESRSKHDQELQRLAATYETALQTQVGEETTRLLEQMRQRESEFLKKEEIIARQYQNNLEQRMAEESAKHREVELDWEAKLQERDDVIDAISCELSGARSAVQQAEVASAERFLANLEKLGMNFLVFHPGAGHISVSVEDLARYIENPIAYAAARCYVTEEQYRAWLRHYENPRCQAVGADGTVCDMRIIRADSPTRFVVGETDRCARHQTNHNIDAVLKFHTSLAGQSGSSDDKGGAH